jgi:phage terminase small subunit
MAVATEEKGLKLTKEQEAFCKLVASNDPIHPLSNTEMAKLAGYSEKSAKEQASRLLTKPHIIKRIEEYQQIICNRFLNKGRILQELAAIGLSNPADVISWNESGACFVKDSDELTPEALASIKSIEVRELVEKGADEGDSKVVLNTKVQFHDKKGALHLLGKEAGMFNDKVEHGGNINVTVKRPGEE